MSSRRPRKSTTARGYGHVHQQTRKRWALEVATGKVRCARCTQLILPTDEWQLDHRDDRQGYLGPSHKVCNLRHGAEVTNRGRRGGVLIDPDDFPDHDGRTFLGPPNEVGYQCRWSQIWVPWKPWHEGFEGDE